MNEVRICEISDTMRGEPILFYTGPFDAVSQYIAEQNLSAYVRNELIEVNTPMGESWDPGMVILDGAPPAVMTILLLRFG